MNRYIRMERIKRGYVQIYLLDKSIRFHRIEFKQTYALFKGF